MAELQKTARLLDPVVRVGEILFGLIMALTFTCSVSIANSNRTEVKQLLIAALSCNIAWGLVDAIMYLVSRLIKLGRNKVIFDSVRRSSSIKEANEQLAEALPPIVASLTSPDELEILRKKLVALPDETAKIRLTMRDVEKAAALFLLVFLSTFPVVIPFLFIQDTFLALRISNLIAIVMMFFCGWTVAGYVGFNRLKMGFAMVLLGVLLVVITISLGG